MAKTILMVDDSKTMRDMVNTTLQQSGFAVLDAEDGKQALDVLAGNNIDLIITDINMPNMDGISLIKQIRSQDKHKFTPIIVLTTEGGDDAKKKGKEAGATGWVVKPFNPEKMLQIVNKLCANG